MPLQVFFHLQTYKRKNYIGKLIGLLVKKHQQRQKKCKKSKKESKLKLFAICKGVYFYLCKVKKRAFILFFFVMLNMFQHITSNAQNLVPNGNFEFYTTCPATWGHTQYLLTHGRTPIIVHLIILMLVLPYHLPVVSQTRHLDFGNMLILE